MVFFYKEEVFFAIYRKEKAMQWKDSKQTRDLCGFAHFTYPVIEN